MCDSYDNLYVLFQESSFFLTSLYVYCQVHVVTALEESANKYSIHQVSLYEKFCVVDFYLIESFVFKII